MSKSGGKSGKSGNKSGVRRSQRGSTKVSSQREMARMQKRQRDRIRRMTMVVGGFIGVIVVIAALAQSLGPTQAANPTGANPTGATPTSAPTSSPIVRQVDVTLTDNAISSSMTSFVTGVQYHFVVHNTAKTARDFMIAPPFQNDESMEQMVKAALFHLSAQALAPGALQSFDFVFDSPTTAGQLQLSTPPTAQSTTGTHLVITVAKG